MHHIHLVLGWDDLGAGAGLRRNEVGFSQVQALARDATPKKPATLNAFLYAFLCPAKNFDLFLEENTRQIADQVRQIALTMEALSRFERTGSPAPASSLNEVYLSLRRILARPGARDELRTLATLLFSGPSSPRQIAEELGMSENLAQRVLRALAPVLEQPDAETYVLRTDTETLATVLFLLRSRLGIDPLAVLQRRITAHAERGA